MEGADPETWYGRVVTSVGRRRKSNGVKEGGRERAPEDEGGRSARRRTKRREPGDLQDQVEPVGGRGREGECRTSQWSEG